MLCLFIICDVSHWHCGGPRGKFELLLMDLYVPEEDLRAHRPAVVLLHGGS